MKTSRWSYIIKNTDIMDRSYGFRQKKILKDIGNSLMHNIVLVMLYRVPDNSVVYDEIDEILNEASSMRFPRGERINSEDYFEYLFLRQFFTKRSIRTKERNIISYAIDDDINIYGTTKLSYDDAYYGIKDMMVQISIDMSKGELKSIKNYI